MIHNNFASKIIPSLVLGTAMWGWTIPKQTAFELLDSFYENGFRKIDTATNYPINKNPADFRKAEMILQEWTQIQGIHDLQIIIKIGSINNLRSPEHNLNKSFILLNLDEYRFKFGSNLNMLMVHWDNRDEQVVIQDTLEALDIARQCGLEIGLSGIRHPALYATLNKTFQFDFHIEIKHNLLQSDYQHYSYFQDKRRFLAYGINAGGLKLNPSEYREDSSLRARGGTTDAVHPIVIALQKTLHEANQVANRPKLTTMNHIGMLYAYHSPGIECVLVAPSSPWQLHDTIAFYHSLQQFDYTDVFQKLKIRLVSDT